MRKVISSSFVLLILSFSVFAQTHPVHLNSLGFLPEFKKTAAIPHQCETFKVVDAVNGKEVFTGKTTGPEFQEDVNQNVWTRRFFGPENSRKILP
jgi:endoglucanase